MDLAPLRWLGIINEVLEPRSADWCPVMTNEAPPKRRCGEQSHERADGEKEDNGEVIVPRWSARSVNLVLAGR